MESWVLLQQAIGGVGHPAREARAVQQAIQRGEVVEALLLQHRAQVELDIGLLADERAVAQQAQGQAVGHHAPQVLGAVEVLLHQRMGGQAGAARGRRAVQPLARPDDVQRRRVLGLAHAVRDGEAHPVHLAGAGRIARLDAQQAEERDRPGVAGDAGGRVALRQAPQAVLKRLPVLAAVGEGGCDFVEQVAPAIQAKIGRLLAGQLAAQQLLHGVWAEQAAFDADGRESHHAVTTGCRTSRPSRSAGSCTFILTWRADIFAARRTRL
jgi:HEAT repeat protein